MKAATRRKRAKLKALKAKWLAMPPAEAAEERAKARARINGLCSHCRINPRQRGPRATSSSWCDHCRGVVARTRYKIKVRQRRAMAFAELLDYRCVRCKTSIRHFTRTHRANILCADCNRWIHLTDPHPWRTIRTYHYAVVQMARDAGIIPPLGKGTRVN